MQDIEVSFLHLYSAFSGWKLLPWALGLTILLWACSWVLAWRASMPAYKNDSRWPGILALLGTLVIGAFMGELWHALGRPPMRTLGETRMWNCFFVSLVIGILYFQHRWFWMLFLGHSGALIFGLFTLFNPEWMDRTLRPALQSPWFVPHVATYMISYGFLTAAAVAVIPALFPKRQGAELVQSVNMAERLARLGLVFLTMGMILGAYWAKEAWGHYWSWDPKETWALITWLALIFLLHYRNLYPQNHRGYSWIVIITLIVLLITWFGVQYLPSTVSSLHTYTS